MPDTGAGPNTVISEFANVEGQAADEVGRQKT
jgi:hypothetical protein